ncbi:MAG: endonuclease/exonuclease/phosphatase family protein [Alistipes sp.]|nr:endonuclease/exonuclease/phosphatase family protein [Alistipes sp.]
MARTNGNIYRDYRKGKTKRKRSFSLSLLLFILDIAMVCVLFLLCAATIICVVTPNSSPERLGIFSIVVLGAPIIYMLMVITTLYWALRWKWSLAFISFVFLFVGTLSVGKYYRIDLKQDAMGKYPKKVLKVMSYNIANSNSTSLVDSIASHRPTILCLQEYQAGGEEAWARLGEKYTTTANSKSDFSCEIFTNQRIIKHGKIDSLPRFNAIWADILMDKDTIRVVNLHLQSTTITAQDMAFVERHKYVLDSARSHKIKSITDKLVENTIYRSNQAKKVREFIDQNADKKMIICGDFNDVPLSYSYNIIAEPLISTFAEAGSGYTYTFDGFFKLMAIDHMLVTDHFDVLSYEVDYTMGESDHYPVITRLKTKSNKQ